MNTATLFKKRRMRLTRQTDELIVIAAHAEVQKVADTPFPFTQESNFLYLTGVHEPDWKLLYDGTEWVLIQPVISESKELFDGAISAQEVRRLSGIDTILDKDTGERRIAHLLENAKRVGVIEPDPHANSYSFSINPLPMAVYEQARESTAEIVPLRSALAKLRGLKDDEEIQRIRQAVRVTSESFDAVKAKLHGAQFEYHLAAEFTYLFHNAGLVHAYEPIIASAGNACTLHYGKNSAALPENGLVLMDVGAQYQDYAADITRTYAIGTPSEREVAVHAAVEAAHHKIIALLKPNLSVKTYHETVDEIMKDALNELGLLNTPDDYRKYFPHAISHGLGIDVHDPLGAPKYFEPGMVLTVEPGIYIPEEGIGVRIEDDILITETGHENLSGQLSTAL